VVVTFENEMSKLLRGLLNERAPFGLEERREVVVNVDDEEMSRTK
jgi:hypothetical protein